LPQALASRSQKIRKRVRGWAKIANSPTRW
jgi:hypothetical protein